MREIKFIISSDSNFQQLRLIGSIADDAESTASEMPLLNAVVSKYEIWIGRI